MDDPVTHRLRICCPRSVCLLDAGGCRTASSPGWRALQFRRVCHQNEI